MTTDQCACGKVTETNIVHRNSKNLGKKEKNKMECLKRLNFKICKMLMGGNDTHKNKLVKIFNAKMKC